jgi:hypothetical protein
VIHRSLGSRGRKWSGVSATHSTACLTLLAFAVICLIPVISGARQAPTLEYPALPGSLSKGAVDWACRTCWHWILGYQIQALHQTDPTLWLHSWGVSTFRLERDQAAPLSLDRYLHQQDTSPEDLPPLHILAKVLLEVLVTNNWLSSKVPRLVYQGSRLNFPFGVSRSRFLHLKY